MAYITEETPAALIMAPDVPATAAVVWLHGLGADGYDFAPIVEELRLPATLGVKFVFPHATTRPVTINNGYVMRAWYDIRHFGGAITEDSEGIAESAVIVEKHIRSLLDAGIASRRIVLGGFSQGGAMALHVGLRFAESLAGIVALSTYLPLRDRLSAEASSANRGTPILMCHGSRDPVVPELAGQISRDVLVSLGYAVEWRTYPMEHRVSMDEIMHISGWLQQVL